jgi:hypothetical protein
VILRDEVKKAVLLLERKTWTDHTEALRTLQIALAAGCDHEFAGGFCKKCEVPQSVVA